MNRLTKLTIALWASALTTLAVQADQYTIGQTVTLREVNVTPGRTVRISAPGLGTNVNVYAGVTNLVVDGVGVAGFCIDPFQFSNTSDRQYTVAALASAPVPAMGADAAADIAKLWANFYSADMSNDLAANVQIAIWKIVGGGSFSIYGSIPSWYNDLTVGLPNMNGTANLVALTSADWQDFVVEYVPVPDGGLTALLLGMGLTGLVMIRRRL